MLTATPNGTPATFVAINGMISPSPQLTGNSGNMFSLPTNIGAPNFVTSPNLLPTPFLLPQTAFPTAPPNLTCTVPFSSPQFQSSFLPFLGPTNGNILTTTPPTPFANGLSQFMPPQSLATPISAFPTSLSAGSVLNPINAPVMHPASQLSMNPVSSAMITAQLPAQPLMLSTLPPLPSMSNSGETASITLIPQNTSNVTVNTNTTTTDVSVGNSVPVYTVTVLPETAVTSTVTISSVTTPVSNNERVQSAGASRAWTKPDRYQPEILPTSTAASHTTSNVTNLRALESVDFHRDAILDAIDKLRERKARPDFERISCLLKRYQNINPDQTQLCLGRLADAGAVVCVDYKGNTSYRNPSKWRKTVVTSGLGTTNSLNVSSRLVEAIHYLTNISTGKSPNVNKEQANGISPVILRGPNGGFSLFQIERALQATASSNTPITSSSSSATPQLTGATLRVCLDREATHGKLARTSDGRYVLDETGERKKLNNSVPSSPVINKKPLPPHSSNATVVSSTAGSKSNGNTPIAPNSELPTSRLHPLAAKQPQLSSNVTIAPLGGKLVNSNTVVLSPRALGTKRGRPPGSKSRKHSMNINVLPVPGKKLQKIEPAVCRPIPVATVLETTNRNLFQMAVAGMGTGMNLTKPDSIAIPPFSSTTLPLPSSFITGMTPANVCSTVFPGSILPPPTFGNQLTNTNLAHTLPSPFLSLSTAVSSTTPTVSCMTGIPNLVPVIPSNISGELPSTKFSMSIPSTVSDCYPSDNHVNANVEKCDTGNLCARCGGPPSKEEIFLVCKDCGLHAHPTCLDYWPELTERARQSPWQCTDCKTCSVCQSTEITTELLICDACDKGFHAECHKPNLLEHVDRSLPWVCADCQEEGYSVAIGTMPEGAAITETTTDTEGIVSDKQGKIGDDSKENDLVVPSEKTASDLPAVDLSESDDQAPIDVSSIEPNLSSGIDLSDTPTLKRSSPSNQIEDISDKRNSPVNPTSSIPTATTINENSGFGKGSPVEQTIIIRDHLCSPDSQEANQRIASHSTRQQVSDVESNSESVNSIGPNITPELNSHVNFPATVDPHLDKESTGREHSCDSHSDSNTEQDTVMNDRCSPRPVDIRAWSVNNVKEWLLEEGFIREAEAFSQQEIDGACLLLMKRMDVLTELGIKLGPAVKIYERIKRLQSQCTSPTILAH